jgi:hypothetical protein
VLSLSFQGEFSFQDHTWKTISSSAKELISSLLSVEPYKRPTASDVCPFFHPHCHTLANLCHTQLRLLNPWTLLSFVSSGPAAGASLGDRGLREAGPHGRGGRDEAAEVQRQKEAAGGGDRQRAQQQGGAADEAAAEPAGTA